MVGKLIKLQIIVDLHLSRFLCALWWGGLINLYDESPNKQLFISVRGPITRAYHEGLSRVLGRIFYFVFAYQAPDQKPYTVYIFYKRNYAPDLEWPMFIVLFDIEGLDLVSYIFYDIDRAKPFTEISAMAKFQYQSNKGIDWLFVPINV